MTLTETSSQALPKIKRVTIFVGFSCNNDCMFCASADKRIYGDRTTEEIKKDLQEAYDHGARDAVLSGGECTLRDDILEIVKFARRRGYLNVQLQSNGRKFASREFCREVFSAGCAELAIALHGPTAEIHDGLVRRKGAFRQTVLGIYNARSLMRDRVRVLTNSVVTKSNYKALPQLADLLIKLGVDLYQFAFVHPMGNAYKYFKDVVPRKTAALPYLKRGLDLGLKKGIRVRAEAVPLCLMQGYESCVSEFYIPPTEVREQDRTIEDFQEVRIHDSKAKFEKCKACKYGTVCEGPWKEYPEHYGDGEFVPVKAEP